MITMVDSDSYAAQQYRIKALKEKVEGYENGSLFLKMKEGQRRQRAYYERRLLELKKEIGGLHSAGKKNREMWFQTFQDVQDECSRKLALKDKELEEMRLLLAEAERKNEKLQAKLREKTEEAVQARAETQDEKEKNQKLQAQANRNSRNSSEPSSKDEFRAKVVNNREKSGNPPGALPGHEGYGRPVYAVNDGSVFIPAPEEVENNPDYYRTGGEVHKRVVGIQIIVKVKDYWAYRYRNRRTGTKYHPPFPENVVLDVNYDDSIKAFVINMKDILNVSEEKIREFISDITGGEVRISRGMINRLNREFAKKSEKERDDMFSRLATADVLYTDMTGARMNGQLKNIVVCTDGDDIMYFFRDKKGDGAIKGTPVEICTNVLVHDHDKTFYHYGGAHQECNEHHLRYLKGAAEIETNLTWHKKMRSLLQEMNTTRESQNRVLSEEQITDFEKRYDEIVELADKEYDDNPPSQYYRKGFNLSKEFREYKESILRFLKDPKVDFTNNVSERGCRKPKRHLAVSGTFRGTTNRSGEEYCDAMGVIQAIRAKGGNVHDEIRKIFRRPMPEKKCRTEVEEQEN